MLTPVAFVAIGGDGAPRFEYRRIFTCDAFFGSICVHFRILCTPKSTGPWLTLGLFKYIKPAENRQSLPPQSYIPSLELHLLNLTKAHLASRCFSVQFT
jgi:hypothetical protein